MVKTAAYVKTKLGKNLGKMLDYVGNDNRPPHYKSKNKKFLKSNLNHHDRVLDSAGVNCSSSYKEAIKEMDSTYKRFGYKKGHPQCVHTIIAFNPKDFSFSSYKDRVKALDMTKEIIKDKYPHNQSMIALQADNKKHILHTHTITCNKTLDSGKSVSHDASCERTLPYVQEVMKKNGYTVYNPFKPEKRFKFQTNKFNTIIGPKITVPNNAVRLKHQPNLKTSTNEFNLVRNNKKSYVTEIKNHFASAIQLTKPTSSKSKNIQNLIKNSEVEGIQMSCFSMKRNKKTGEHEIHYYKKPPKHRAVKLPNGWARIRKTWSLKYHYKYRNKEDKLINKPITIRTSKMGAEFSPTNIMNNLGTNKITNAVTRNVARIHHDKSYIDAYYDTNINNGIKFNIKHHGHAVAHKIHASKVASSLTPAQANHLIESSATASAKSIVPKVESETPDNAQPVMQSTTSKASSEDDEDSVSSKSSSKPRVSPAPMPKFNVHIKTYATHNLNGYLSVPKKKAFLISPFNMNYVHYGEHYFKKYHHFFKYPIFTSPRLENLIQRDLRESDSEDKKISDLKNFENNCNKEDQDSINQRVEDESDYYAAKQAIRDAAVDIHNIEAAVERDKKLHHLQ